jgi:hypothetical protein
MAVSIILGISLTAIAAVFHISPDGRKIIVMGADGLETITWGNNERTATVTHREVCKIRNTAGFYYAMDGLRAGGSSYDAYKEMERALATPGDFKARVALLESQTVTALNGINAPLSDQRIEILIIDSESFPSYYFGVIDREANGRWSMRSSSGIREGPMITDTSFVGMGIGKRAAELKSRLPTEQIATIREMLQLEAIDRPKEVGEPFSIVRITDVEAEWQERGVCAEPTTKPVKNRESPKER